MEDCKKLSSEIVKIKYEVDKFNLEKMQPFMKMRININRNGNITFTEFDSNDSSKQLIYKIKFDQSQTNDLFDTIQNCIFSINNFVDFPIDDVGRCITLYFENGKTKRVPGIYSLDGIDTETIFYNLVKKIKHQFSEMLSKSNEF